MKRLWLLILCGLPLQPAVLANEQPSVNASTALTEQRSLSREDVGGLITGQTVTQNGRAFYDSFATAWSERDAQGRFSVAVMERPTARFGSQVFIRYGNRQLLQLALPPNRSVIAPLGAAAADQVFQAILDYQLAQFLGDPDIGRDEF